MHQGQPESHPLNHGASLKSPSADHTSPHHTQPSFGSSNAHKGIREILVENHKLDGVISMPSGVFKPYAGVSTAVLIFTKIGVKKDGTDYVWFYDMKADGLSLDDKRQPVEANDIPDILARWKDRDPKKDTDRTAKAFFVPKSEIKENGYDLSINRYKVRHQGR